ncbi:MAG: hypothetical protein Ct9H300mP2_3230 [Candidatus Neomarinimicrobiota bacterium]|nr:MAG: hypothetical protein Ct9H300mP2_3230 [Candidatus Neomarinimicrobiota bacterium]
MRPWILSTYSYPFSHQHDIRRLDNGNITIYDNGNYKEPNYSRAAEYLLDEDNMTATLISEYREPGYL